MNAKKILTSKTFIAANLLFALFCAYFLFGIYISYKIQNYTGWNDAIFNSDSHRVISDFFANYTSNYRTKVHPIYVLLIQPVVRFLYLFLHNEHISIVLLQSAVGVLNVYLFYRILSRIAPRTVRGNAVKYVLTALFAVSMAQFTWTAAAESFIFGGCSILIYFAYFAAQYGRPLEKNTRLFAFCFVCCIPLCITTTNFICVVVSAPFFLFAGFPKGKGKARAVIGWTFFAYLIPVCVLTVLAAIQKCIWPTSEIWISYLGDVFSDLFFDTNLAEDAQWIRTGLSLSVLLTVIKTFFGYGIVSGKLDGTKQVVFGGYSAWQTPLFLLFLLVFIYALYSIVRNRRTIAALPYFLALAFQCGMHCFFSPETAALYTPHIVPLILILLCFGISNARERETSAEDRVRLGITAFLALFVLYALVVNILRMCDLVRRSASFYTVLDVSVAGEFCKGLGFAAFAVVVITIVRMFLCAAFCRKACAAGSARESEIASAVSQKSGRSAAFCLLCGLLSFVIAFGTVIGCVSNDGAVAAWSAQNDPVYYIFGMGLREKFILEGTEENCSLTRWEKEGGETVYSDLTVRTEDIDYANYTVEGTLEGSSFSLYENEEGIFFSTYGEITALSEGICINIPSFEGYSNRLDMRRIFNEMMVNILPVEGPSPNFMIYGNAWYRDAAMVAMALEKTGNLSQIEDWLKSIDKIYDNRRSAEIDETDNLGQVLYLQSLLPEEARNEALIAQVIAEAARIAEEAGTNYICGITDYEEHPVYQTRWLKFGLESLGLTEESAKYSVPDAYDSYAALCWFDGLGEIGSDMRELDWAKENDTLFPYLRIAKLHFYKIRTAIDYETYPYTYEAENKLHSWHAAELLLYMYDVDTFV